MAICPNLRETVGFGRNVPMFMLLADNDFLLGFVFLLLNFPENQKTERRL